MVFEFQLSESIIHFKNKFGIRKTCNGKYLKESCSTVRDKYFSFKYFLNIATVRWFLDITGIDRFLVSVLTFENNFGIMHTMEKYLNESFSKIHNENFSFKYFSYIAFI